MKATITNAAKIASILILSIVALASAMAFLGEPTEEACNAAYFYFGPSTGIVIFGAKVLSITACCLSVFGIEVLYKSFGR